MFMFHLTIMQTYHVTETMDIVPLINQRPRVGIIRQFGISKLNLKSSKNVETFPFVLLLIFYGGVLVSGDLEPLARAHRLSNVHARLLEVHDCRRAIHERLVSSAQRRKG